MVDQESRHIKVHNDNDFEGMRRAGKLAAETLDFITPVVQPAMQELSASLPIRRFKRELDENERGRAVRETFPA